MAEPHIFQMGSHNFRKEMRRICRERAKDLRVAENIPEPEVWEIYYPLTVPDEAASTFNFNNIQNNPLSYSHCMLRKSFQGLVDRNDTSKLLDPGAPTPAAGVLPWYMLHLAYTNTTGLVLQIAETYYDLPSGLDVRMFFRRALVQLITVHKFAFPTLICISFDLHLSSDGIHQSFFQHLFTTLPSVIKPCYYFEPGDVSELWESVFFRNLESHYALLIERASLKNTQGKKEYREGHIGRAIMHFHDALTALIGILHIPALLGNKTSFCQKLAAVCWANISAAWALPGKWQNLEVAKAEAEKAIGMDLYFARGHYRLSIALERLGQKEAAMDRIADALRLPQLGGEVTLAERLINLQTDGKGLPSTKGEMDEWTRNMLMQERMRKLGKSSWMKLCMEHKKKLKE